MSVLKDKKIRHLLIVGNPPFLMGWDENLKLNFSIKMRGIELIGRHETNFVFLLC